MKLNRFVRLMALLLAMGLTTAVNAAQVYLDVPDEFDKDNASWYVWAWADGQTGDWVTGTKLNHSLYVFNVDVNNMQFVRKSPDGQTAWNWSSNMTVVPDGLFTINSLVSGTWSTFSTDKVLLELPEGGSNDDVWYAWSFSTATNESWVQGERLGDKIEF